MKSLLSHGKITAVLQYFTDRFDDYWHIIYPVETAEARQADKFLYFYDISRKATDYTGAFSPDGIYLFRGYDGHDHLYPLEIAQYGLACWLAWRKTGESLWTGKAAAQCCWLADNMDESGFWRMDHKKSMYSSMPDRWPSALAQGLGASALLRMYYFSGDESWLRIAEKALKAMDIPVEAGGVRRAVRDDIFIYEEYPTDKLNGVLNGHISAVLAWLEVSASVETLSDSAQYNINNLAALLPLYDMGYWTYYSLDGNIDSGFYHRLVTNQLMSLKDLDPVFEKTAMRFASYSDNFFCALRAFAGKVINKI